MHTQKFRGHLSHDFLLCKFSHKPLAKICINHSESCKIICIIIYRIYYINNNEQNPATMRTAWKRIEQRDDFCSVIKFWSKNLSKGRNVLPSKEKIWQKFKKIFLKKYKIFEKFSAKNDRFCEHTAGRQKFSKKSQKIFKNFKFFLKKLLTNKFRLC